MTSEVTNEQSLLGTSFGILLRTDWSRAAILVCSIETVQWGLKLLKLTEIVKIPITEMGGEKIEYQNCNRNGGNTLL